VLIEKKESIQNFEKYLELMERELDELLLKEEEDNIENERKLKQIELELQQKKG
jgi:hypothetical protein